MWEAAMPLAVEIYFDTTAEREIGEIWRQLRGLGLRTPPACGALRPCIRLAAYDDDIRKDALLADMERFTDDVSAFSVDLSYIGTFATDERLLFLGPTVTEQLLGLHRRFHMRFGRYAGQQWGYHAVGHWVPYCALAHDVSDAQIKAAWNVLKNLRLPLRCDVREIGLNDLTPPRPLAAWMLVRH
jgi:hypothetical protein